MFGQCYPDSSYVELTYGPKLIGLIRPIKLLHVAETPTVSEIATCHRRGDSHTCPCVPQGRSRLRILSNSFCAQKNLRVVICTRVWDFRMLIEWVDLLLLLLVVVVSRWGMSSLLLSAIAAVSRSYREVTSSFPFSVTHSMAISMLR